MHVFDGRCSALLYHENITHIYHLPDISLCLSEDSCLLESMFGLVACALIPMNRSKVSQITFSVCGDINVPVPDAESETFGMGTGKVIY